MNILRTAKDLKPGRRGVCLAIGFFDGVHLGHQQIIRQTIADARQHDALAVVVTFDRHPNSVVAPAHVPPLIYSLPQKLRTIASLGADALLLLRFNRRFSEESGGAFVRKLVAGFGRVHSICVGANFRFGHRRTGNVTLLKQLGGELGFAVHGLAAVSLDGQAVSSTRIRRTIQAGQLDAASQMLGRSCELCGTVIRGDGLGRKLGFPTANLAVAGWSCLRMVSMPSKRLSMAGRAVACSTSACARPCAGPNRSCARKFTCSISMASFTAKNWRLPSSRNCEASAGSHRLTPSAGRSPRMSPASAAAFETAEIRARTIALTGGTSRRKLRA